MISQGPNKDKLHLPVCREELHQQSVKLQHRIMGLHRVWVHDSLKVYNLPMFNTAIEFLTMLALTTGCRELTVDDSESLGGLDRGLL